MLWALGNKVSLFFEKLFQGNMTKDACSPGCSGSHLMTEEAQAQHEAFSLAGRRERGKKQVGVD